MAFKLFTYILTRASRSLLALAVMWTMSLESHGQERLFRYKNDKGVIVIGYSIPPKYTQNGYDIISPSGKILEVVPPAPTEAELSVSRARQEIMNAYDKLRLRYSQVEDIEAARDRRLAGIDTNVQIVKTNIKGLEDKLAEQLKQAATQERTQGKASEGIVNQIATTRAELAVARSMLKTRSAEFESAKKKYQEDIELYLAGQALIKQYGNKQDR